MAKKDDPLREASRYHLVLSDGTERTVSAFHLRQADGALQLLDYAGEFITIYAPGQWKYAELERKDE